jgi:succinate dehydrogenase/fumarate reductase flavoprotein subunit
MQRAESRGAHSRLDFPDTDPAWAGLNSVVTRRGDTMRVTTAAIPPMEPELRELALAAGGA